MSGGGASRTVDRAKVFTTITAGKSSGRGDKHFEWAGTDVLRSYQTFTFVKKDLPGDAVDYEALMSDSTTEVPPPGRWTMSLHFKLRRAQAGRIFG